MMSDLTAVSLFAGVGGFDLAMERNGIVPVAEWIMKRLVETLA